MALLAVAFLSVGSANVAFAEDSEMTCEVASGNYLDEDYVSVYKIPTNLMTFEANGNGEVAKAFDGDWNTFWKTNIENQAQGSANPTFLNAITVTFTQPVTIQSILYASSSERLGHGYPVVLNIYTDKDGELSLYGTCESEATNDRVLFPFKEAVTVTQIKFEFRKVNPKHNWTATAKEICFLQPDNPSANKVLDLFDDYAQYVVNEEYKSSLSELRDGVRDLICYDSALKPLLDRAEEIVSGGLVKDGRREFSTDPNAENVITQYGNLRSYAGETLKMSSFGINRQVLGVGGLTGQTITVYVEAEKGDKLPSIAFTQVYGDWRSWQSTRNLSLGKNVFTVPNFVTANYTNSVVPGGPIHIINPYEPSEQSSNVKVYVEGGYLYPVFRKGEDVNSFIEDLKSYYNEMQNTEGMSDVTELVGDHFIHTASATTAYNDFVSRSVNPQTNAEKWDDYISALLEFGGVALNPEGEHFNEKNLHLYTNFRMVQPWEGAGAFAAGDHIGFITFGGGLMTNFTNAGWGVAHEIGHALDVNGRTIGETTNNMWSKFALAYFNHDVSRNFNAQMTNVMTPDETAVSAGYFNTNVYNYQIWWNLEACHHGFWGNLDNTYRYYDEATARADAGVTSEDGNLTATERMVYYSSLVVGEDLGYYYERFGFSFSTGENYAPFKIETATSAYKKLIAKALEVGKIIERGFKYWYIDANQYFYDISEGGCYNPSNGVEIREIWKTNSGYTLLLPEPEADNAHLGYEITEYRNGNWYVIGFTYSSSFNDTTEYADGYVPQYKVRAYDRGMEVSAESEIAIFKEFTQTAVCRIGEVYYDSLTEAVASASANDVIFICADLCDGGIIVNKNLTLLPDPSITDSVVITKRLIGPIFTVNGGVTFTIGNNDGARIVLDGNSFTQNGALIRVNGGTLRVNNAELRNNRNTDHGGAVYNTGNSTFTNVTIKNNFTSINGGAIANFGGGVIALTDCTVSNNHAKAYGGAFTLDGKTTLTRVTITDNVAGDLGGAMYMACGNNARSVTVNGGEMRDNKANKGSAIYLDNGSLTIVGGESGAHLFGEIYKNNGSLNVSVAMLDFSNVTFKTSSVADGAVLLTASGLTFTEEDLTSVNVVSADVYLSADNKNVLIKPWPTITINVNGTEITQQVAFGAFVLPDTMEGIEESQYITAWEVNGIYYLAGEGLEITANCAIKAVIANKFAVRLRYGDEEEQTCYVKPNGNLVLEECVAPQGKKFSHWEINGVSYKAGDSVCITGDTVATAVFEEVPESDNSTQNTPSDGSDSQTTVPTGSDKLSVGIIAVIVVIALLVVVGMPVAVVIIKKRKKSGKEKD